MTAPADGGARPEVDLDELAGIVGREHVLSDPDAMAGYLVDWTGRWTGHADAVVRPADTEQVSRLLAWCTRHRVDVCVQGGNTGLVGGSVPPAAPAAPTLLLSTTRMTGLDDVDVVGRCVGVGAGTTIDTLDRHAAASGLRFGVDLASRASATAGGVVATNAGGMHMIRHGNTRSQILGLEAVLADGRILRRWTPLVKDNVGYDLPGLIAGSEGTLAVITRVLFALVSPPSSTMVAVLAVTEPTVITGLIADAQKRGLVVEAAEIMTDEGLDLVADHGARRPYPTRAPFHALLEFSGTDDAADLESRVLQMVAEADGVLDAVGEPGPARELWAIRDGHTESIARSTNTPVVKLDISVPIGHLTQAFRQIDDLTTAFAHPARPILFGHVGDGNIHVNLLDVAPADAHAATEQVFEVVAGLGGSISAEHGIGRAKTEWTHLGRDVTDRAAMRAIKTALDPDGILNPGVLFAEPSSP